MASLRLEAQARVILGLNILYNIADSLCSVFVGVYFYSNAVNATPIYQHYFWLLNACALTFVLAGWYAQVKDRVHVLRLGLFIQAIVYGIVLYLRESAVDYAIPLGILLGIGLGSYYAGTNTLHFDATTKDKRSYFLGWMNAGTGAARFIGPVFAGKLINVIPEWGYECVFFTAVVLYLAAFLFSFRVHDDGVHRPYLLGYAVNPFKMHRDWCWFMGSSFFVAGSYMLIPLLLSLLMFVETENAFYVGVFMGVQSIVNILVSYAVGRWMQSHHRKATMFWSSVAIALAGGLILVHWSITTLIVFSLIRAVAMPLFQVPYISYKFDIIDRVMPQPGHRIEFIVAWELPLWLGRFFFCLFLIYSAGELEAFDVRVCLFLLCAQRLLAHWCTIQTDVVRESLLRAA